MANCTSNSGRELENVQLCRKQPNKEILAKRKTTKKIVVVGGTSVSELVEAFALEGKK